VAWDGVVKRAELLPARIITIVDGEAMPITILRAVGTTTVEIPVGVTPEREIWVQVTATNVLPSIPLEEVVAHAVPSVVVAVVLPAVAAVVVATHAAETNNLTQG
jgi:hypothetical protein